MSVLTDAHVSITLADFANNDAAGKLNIVGGGIAQIGVDPTVGATPPFTLVVNILVPDRHSGSSYALTVELHDATTGQIVQMPTPLGQAQPLRAQQVVDVPHPQVPLGAARPDGMMLTNTLVMGFPSGLPLVVGHSYEWRVQIDGQTRNWWYRFHVLGPAPGPVFGGPTNTPDIPGVGTFVVDPPEAQPDEPA